MNSLTAYPTARKFIPIKLLNKKEAEDIFSFCKYFLNKLFGSQIIFAFFKRNYSDLSNKREISKVKKQFFKSSSLQFS